FISGTIVNRSYKSPLFRCRAPVAVASDSDPHAVEDALLEAARQCEGVLQQPPPAVRFRAFGESGLHFELLCWTDKMVHRPGALVSSLNFHIHDTLKRRGIRLPFPLHQVTIRGAGAALLAPEIADPAASPGTGSADASQREVPR
ncbi:MAG: mechanosensitive ion channel protein MscS, partial [Acidobacteriota bacterium]